MFFRPSSRWYLIAAMVCCSATSATADDAPGIAIGEKAPDFTLVDQNDKTVTLSKLIEQGNVAVVFHRSADW